jgi:hypothetical protein
MGGIEGRYVTPCNGTYTATYALAGSLTISPAMNRLTVHRVQPLSNRHQRNGILEVHAVSPA